MIQRNENPQALRKGRFSFAGWFCITKSNRGSRGAGWLGIVSWFAFFSMQNFLALASLSAMLTTLAWSHATEPLPRPDRQAYQACTQLHPQRYCAITHLGQ